MMRETSLDAGRSAVPSSAKTRAIVFRHLLMQGDTGATLFEMEQALAMSGNTVRPRRCELEERGYVKDSGRRRATPSGRQAIVWVVPDAIRGIVEARLAAK